MKNRMRSKQNSGFTLVEVLATVGIIVILLAVAMVSVIRYIDVLKIAELDNAARDIYMAVENRTVLLSGAQRLDNLVAEPGHYGALLENGLESNNLEVHTNPDEELYYVHSDNLNKELLTTGGIDPTLLDNGEFYIVYDLASGSVTDVFYAEKADSVDVPLQTLVGENTDFKTFYGHWADTRSERLGLKNPSDSSGAKNSDKTLVGWYNGEAAQSGAFGKDTSMKPYLDVIIENREKLTVTVTARGEYVDYISALKVRLGPKKLDSEGNAVELDETNSIDLMRISHHTDDSDGASYSCVWVLDSLTGGIDNGPIHFKTLNLQNIAAGFTLGDDFMVTATIKQDSDKEAFAWDVNNSLFQEGSDNDDHIAYIRYLRHLQNLDAGNGFNSGVENNIASASQTAHIQVSNNDVYPEYHFVPIYNGNLTSYDGNSLEIHNLNVDLTDTDENANEKLIYDKTSLGLFRETPAAGMELHNIRLINATVKASGASVGALVGKTSGATSIDNCWVYWDTDGYVTGLKAALGTNERGFNYQLTGAYAGGLVGQVNGETTIQKSLAATLISGKTAAGGLVGRWNGSPTADPSISNSYADCYLTGDTRVAGLIGEVANGKTVELEYCYAAGFIVGLKENGRGGPRIAGLCMGGGRTNTQHVYTVMQYINDKREDVKSTNKSKFDQYNQNIYYLTEHENYDSFDNYTHYLGSDDVEDATGRHIGHSNYDAMTNRVDSGELKNFVDVMNGDSGDGKFAWKDTADSFPYGLMENLALTYYNYPGLKDLPHYCDWGAEFRGVSLVYYERYSDGTWGLSGNNARNVFSESTLSNNKTIISDGYAVAFLDEEIGDQGQVRAQGETVTIKYTYSDYDKDGNFLGLKVAWQKEIPISKLRERSTTLGEGSNKQTAYLVPLPDELVYSEYAQGCYYRFVRFEMSLSWDDENNKIHSVGECFYNPHFPETVKPYATAEKTSFLDDYGKEQNHFEDYAETLIKKEEIKIRSPRHLYDLSRFLEYYDQSRYTFYQVMDLDYDTYDWRTMYDHRNILYDAPGLDSDGTLASPPYRQDPIGKNATDFFYGTYDGGCHVIRNVQPKMSKESMKTNLYVGLFGYSTGRLQNIVYELSPNNYDPDPESEAYPDKNYTMTAGVEKIAGDLYVGALAGYSMGTIDNCAVYGVCLDMEAPGVQLYVGGLVGNNSGTITNSAAECARLAANSYSSGNLYIGGFVGKNSAMIATSYAVGHIKVDASQGGKADVCGFAGSNGTSISNSYAAMYLETSGTGISRYNFYKGYAGGTGYFLDQGSFTYRGEDYATKYSDDPGSTTYDELTGGLMPKTGTDGKEEWKRDQENPVSGMTWADHSPQQGVNPDLEEPFYPYPTAVKNGEGESIHYGQWPGAVPMGDFGVLYWEEMASVSTDANGNYVYSNYSYHFDALTVKVNKDGTTGTITERNTLIESHDDGRVVLNYGYGYYYAGDIPPEFSASGLGYFVYKPDVLTVPGGTSGKITGARNKDALNGIGEGSEAGTGIYTGGELVKDLDRRNFVDELKTGVDGNHNYGKTADGKPAVYEGYNKTAGSNERLAEVIPGEFTVVSWDSYHEGGRPSEGWSGTEAKGTAEGNYKTERKAQSTAGLVPVYQATNKIKSTWTKVEDGVFKLSRTQTSGGNKVTVEFIIDPHFAGALSVKTVNGSKDTAEKWAQGNTKLTTVPGSSSANPFQIRSGSQLQEINTSTSFYTDFCIGMGGPLASAENKYWDFPTAERFPYLSSVNVTGNYSKVIEKGQYNIGKNGENWDKYYRYFYFEQTHDVDWTAEGNVYYHCETCKKDITRADKEGTHAGHKIDRMPGVFTPIAAAAGRMADTIWNLVDMPGWFAGSYDGRNYTIKNLHIDINTEDFNTSCIGLFGAVYNNSKAYEGTNYTKKVTATTTLTNIVLYSETGDEEVIVRGRAAGTSREPGGGAFTCAVRWYAGGCLVGAAVGQCDISNCAVAGYTIIDRTETAADNINLATENKTGTLDKNKTSHYGPDGSVASVGYQARSGLQYIGSRDSRIVGGGFSSKTSGTYGRSVFFVTNAEVIAGAVGGLVGLTDGNLTNCAAVTNMILMPNHIDQFKNESAMPRTIVKAEKKPVNGTDFSERVKVNVFYDSCGEGSPVRAGGLVGSIVGTVENCYTGGEIILVTPAIFNDPEKNGGRYDWFATNCTMNIGRIAGGVGAGVFVGDPNYTKSGSTLKQNAYIKNCYTYMIMPTGDFGYQKDDAERTHYVIDSGYGGWASEFGLIGYNIGGDGITGQHADKNVVNKMTLQGVNYYLKDGTGGFYIDNANNLPGDGKDISYRQLAGKEAVGSYDDIYLALNGGKTGDNVAYKEVTKTVGEDGVTVTGRFSYTPQDRLDLQDRDYPFPTVLTRDHNGAEVNVHYGNWPSIGIHRDTGGTPISLDLFVGLETPDSTEANPKYWPPGYYEDATLKLVGVSGAGAWAAKFDQVKKADGTLVDPLEVKFEPATPSAEVKMIVKANPEIVTPLTTIMTVTCTVSGTEYTLDIPVNITANIALEETQVSVYPYDTVSLKPLEINPDLGIKADYGYDLKIEGVECVGGLLTAEKKTAADGNGVEYEYIMLTRTDTESKDTVWVDVTYSYTQYYNAEKTEFHTESGKTHRIEVTFLDPLPNGVWTKNDSGQWIWTLDFDFENCRLKPAELTSVYITNAGTDMESQKNFSARLSGTKFILTKTNNDFKIQNDINLDVTMPMKEDGLVHELLITAPRPITEDDLEAVLVKAEPDEGEPGEGGTISWSWTIDFSGLELNELDVRLADEGNSSDFEVQLLDDNNRIVTITWTGGPDDKVPEKVELKVILKKGSLKQDCVLTIALPQPKPEDSGGQDVDDPDNPTDPDDPNNADNPNGTEEPEEEEPVPEGSGKQDPEDQTDEAGGVPDGEGLNEEEPVEVEEKLNGDPDTEP